MDKGDYRIIEDKLDKQTVMLTDIQLEIAKEVNLLKLAHQKLKYTVGTLSAIVLIFIAIEYPKILKVLKGIL